MRCDQCHQREASVHVCNIIDGAKTTRNLCEECLESSTTPEAALVREMRGARCDFCGALANTGGTDTLAVCGGEEERSLSMCQDCSEEFNRFTAEALETVAEDLPRERQLATFRQVRQDADRHMEKWVSRKLK